MRAALLCSFATLLLVAPLAAQPQRVARPVVRLRLENAKLFRDSSYAPLFRGLGELLAERLGIEGEAERGRLDDSWKRLRWPVELVVLVERKSELPIAGVWMPEATPPLLGALCELAGATATPSPVEYDGASFAHVAVPLGGGGEVGLCEGAHGGRRLLLVGTTRGALTPAESLELFVRSCARVTPSQRALIEAARGGDVGWVLDRQALGDGGEEAMLRLLFGPHFGGIAGRVQVRDEKVEVDVFADVRPASGWAGMVVRRQPRLPSLGAWIPPDATEWVVVDPSVDGAVRGLRSLGIASFGLLGEVKGSDLHESLSWLGEIEVCPYLDTHFTGQVIAATEVGIETQFAKLQNVEGFAVGFGAYDGHRLLAATRAAVNGGFDGEGRATRIDETPAQGPGVHTLMRGGEPALYLAAVPEAVFVAGADPAGGAMLRKILATGGRGAPRAHGEVAAALDRPCTMLGRGHVLRHLTKAMEDLGIDAGSGLRLPVLLRRFLEQHDGVAAWRLIVDDEGAHLHVDL